ncbi:Rho guanine nucleotide exchange factor 12 [Phyllostomus discolor]|nr:Rho guanine nucleotide exchange factor 12 [Phyllostomus discolor]
MPFRTGTGDISACYSLRASTESYVPRDSVLLAFQDSQASNILVMDHMIMTPEIPPAEPEGGLDESEEHFFDAHEVHSDDNPLEGDGAIKMEEKDANLHISGNYLILDGYETVQESSTDEEVTSSLPPQPMKGLPFVDSTHQPQHSLQNALSDGAVSPFTPEFVVQQCWGAVEHSCYEIQSPSACADSERQIMEYIHKIEADLEHLKRVEESYTILWQRLAGSALTDNHSDKS